MKNSISSLNGTHRSGFTLIEILFVFVIIMALVALLVPNILSARNRSNDNRAETQIKMFEGALEDYATQFGTYPTTEQGLRALIFVPANEMTGIQTGLPGMQQSFGTMPGSDPNSMPGGAVAVGGMDMMNPGMGMMNPGMGMTDPSGMGMAGAVGGMQPGMNPGMMPGMDPTGMNPGMDPSMGGTAGMVGGMDPTGFGMGQQGMPGTNPYGLGMSNPNLYTMLKKRATPFTKGDDVPLDPWKRPYRYDNSVTATGVNPFTGEK
ncbi:MAG: type II secretion system protein GspG, partial [Planctomycetaceae bacterium]|nr:type II secretion system protein GspG [Planctomycetaceae bacterium]